MKKKTKKKKNIKRRRRIWGAVIFLLLLVAAVLCVLYVTGNLNRWFGIKSNKTLEQSSVQISVDQDANSVIALGNYVIRACKTGIRAITASGSPRWDYSYEMSQPHLFGCGSYALVADYGTNKALLTDTEGNKTEISAEYPILFAALGENGRVILATTDDGRNGIYLYSSAGKLLLKRVTYQNKDGVPVAAAISDDGKRLCCAYVSYTGGSLCTNIVILDLSDNGADLVDRILGNYQLQDEIVVLLSCAERDLYYVSDSSFGVLNVAKGCVLSWQMEPEYEITFARTGDGVLALCFGNRKAGTALDVSEDFFLYNIKGKELYRCAVGDISSLSYNYGQFTVGNSCSYKAVSVKGRVLWEAELSYSYQGVLPLADRKTMVAQNPGRLDYYTVINKWERSSK